MSVAEDTTAAVSREEFEHQHETIVREEIETFRRQAQAYLSGQIAEDDFRPYRLKHGVYGQRQPGVQMIRVKVPGGLMTARQMEQFALVADRYAGGRGHLTTRQNIQFHFVPLADVADLMHRLADVGLTNREACYNTVRNVTTCTLVRPEQDRSVRRPALRAEAGLRVSPQGPHRRTCRANSRSPSTAARRRLHRGFDQRRRDPAVVRDGERGFRIVIGGGLGPLPTEARLLDEFVPEYRLITRVEAVIRDLQPVRQPQEPQHGAHEVRAARARHRVDERAGGARVRGHPAQRRDRTARTSCRRVSAGYQSRPQPVGTGRAAAGGRTARSGERYDAWLATNVIEQKQPGYAAVTARVSQGNLTSAQMRGLARIAADAGDGLLRVGIDQNLVLAFIPRDRLRARARGPAGDRPGGARRATRSTTW